MDSRANPRLWMAVAAAVFFAASAFPSISAGLEGYSTGHLALLRFLTASFVLAIYAALSQMRLPEARDLPAVALAGFLAFSAYNVLLGYGQTSVPAGTASLLIATIPAFTALWAVAFLEERLGARGWTGVAVSFLGVTLISLGEGEGFGADPGGCWCSSPPSPPASTSPCKSRTSRGTEPSSSRPTPSGPGRCFCCPSRRGFSSRCAGRRLSRPWRYSTWASSPPSSPTRPRPRDHGLRLL